MQLVTAGVPAGLEVLGSVSDEAAQVRDRHDPRVVHPLGDPLVDPLPQHRGDLDTLVVRDEPCGVERGHRQTDRDPHHRAAGGEALGDEVELG